MGTINEDLNGIKVIEDKLTSNKVANFAYTDHAYNNPLTEADGVEYYDPDSEQNIPVADASIMNVNETVLSKGWRSQASSLTRMLMNHFLGRVSYNLNKLNDNVSSLLSTLISHIGSADGIAPLNSSGLLDINKGGTNASTVNGARENLNINNVVNTGDSANVANGGTTKFTTGGAYNLLTSIAPYFSSSTAYVVGALVTYQNKFYECTTAHSAGAWNASHFTARSFSYVFTNYILHAFAPTFSTATAYGVGTFVIYQNRLYKCTTAHSAGAWNASHFALATLNDVTVDTDGKLALKADKVEGATNNDIATLDANGNLKDSGKSLADLTGITDLAPLFSTTATYAVGDYVIYSGNLYRCTEAHSAGAWNASHFTAVTVGGELTNKADIFDLAVPSDAVLHYSFDDLPDYPDGTAVVRLLKNWTSSYSSVWNVWNFTKSIIDNTLKLTTSGLASYGQFYSDYLSTSNIQNKIIKIKFKTTDTFTGVGIQDRGGEWTIRDVPVTKIGTNYYEVTYLVSFTVNYQQQLLFTFSDNTTTNFIIIEDLYIGDGSYSTPIIDNAGGKWNSVSQSGVAVKGVSGKAIRFLGSNYVKGNLPWRPSVKKTFTVSCWVKNWDKVNSTYLNIMNDWETTGISNVMLEFANVSSGKTIYFDVPSENGCYRLGVNADVINWNNVDTTMLHVVGIFNGQNSVLYVNGEKITIANGGEQTLSDTIRARQFFQFGKVYGDSNALYDKAGFDDYLIFDRALTEKEVLALYYNKANTPKFYDINNYNIQQTETDLSGKVDKTTTVNGHALSDNVTVTKGDVGLGSVANTGDSAVPELNGTTKFTTGGAYNFFNKNTDAKSWLSKAFGWAMGRYWDKCWSDGGELLYSLNRTVYTICYNNLWVAGTDHGIIWSENPEKWNLVDNTTTYTFNHIHYAKGIWVACSTGQSLWWSTDGKTWTKGDGVSTTYTFKHVYYAHNIWVACSESHGMFWSTDGKTWTQGTGSNTTYTFNDVYYGKNIWVAGSENNSLWWSSDGKAWTKGTNVSSSDTYRSVYYADNMWVAGGSGVAWSTDGKAWTYSSSLPPNDMVNCIYYANGMWQACSAVGMYYSFDGKTFSSEYVSFSADCRSVYYANGTWVAGTDKGLLWSINGKNWQLGKGNENQFYSQCQFLCVYFAKNYWLAGGVHINLIDGLWYSDFDFVELKD